ncbi:MAG: ABC transporter permease subunit [Crocinitomicaceae bacterium]|jgi:sodium transport system permease protein
MIYHIFKKELLDTLRDRRTLVTMLIIPILIFPLTLNLFVSISSSFEKNASTEILKIGIIGDKNHFLAKELKEIPNEMGKKEMVFFKDSTHFFNALANDSIQLGIRTNEDFNSALKSMIPAEVSWYFDASEIGRKERAENYMKIIEIKAQEQRYIDLQIDGRKTTPFQTNYNNVASDKKMVGMLAGGILPYIFIAFGFIGCMYPAIDLFTGEKERGTIETLLTTPITRWQILIGKMLVVVLSGLVAATCSLLGLYISIEFLDIVENKELLKIIHEILSFSFLIAMFSLLIPLTIFFAGVMIPVAVYAKTFKEAQSIITPLNIIMVLPAMVGFFPGIELNFQTACIPVVNVVLATKELIAGTLETKYLVLSFLIMLSLAILSVLISFRQFGKETNILT